MESNLLSQDTRVQFNIHGLSGTGKITGVSSTLPVVGAIYIIEPDEPIRNEAYDYKHFVCPACYLKEI